MQNLAHNTIGPKTADAINDLIEHSASLKSLNLSCMFPTSKRSKGRACVYCVWIVWIVWIVWVVLLLLPIASTPLTPPRMGGPNRHHPPEPGPDNGPRRNAER